MFVVFTLLNSTGWLPKAWVDNVKTADLWLLCVGMAGVDSRRDSTTSAPPARRRSWPERFSG